MIGFSRSTGTAELAFLARLLPHHADQAPRAERHAHKAARRSGIAAPAGTR